ncbi:MAG: DNA repair exonuclease [bacterium]|nr:DNA repair exonuclease [bacterium]
MVRFLHTADWQLGMTRSYLGSEAQSRFRQARVDVIRRIAGLAVQERCAFVLVCGDVFESNQVEREIVVRALEAMGETPQITFYLLPGNHDPLDAVSVYRSPTFSQNAPSNVVVLERPDPLKTAPGVEVIAAPWRSKDPRADLVNAACDRPGSANVIRIVAGHGQLDSFFPGRHDPGHVSLPGLEEKIEAGSVHYVALGDRHSRTEAGRTGRVWYSGAPEPTAFREVDPGKVLVVSLGADWIEVVERSVGQWRFLDKEWELIGDADIDALDGWLSDLRPKERTIIRMSLDGRISLRQKARLDVLLRDHAAPLAALEVDDRDLVASPDETDIEEFGFSGFARKALADLRELADEGEEAPVARDALVLLRRLIGESR